MFIRTKCSKSGNSHRVQIVESVKEGKRTRQAIIKHIGFAHSEEKAASLKKIAIVEIERIRESRAGGCLFVATDILLDREQLLVNKDKINVRDLAIEKVIVEGPEAVYGRIFDELDFRTLLDNQQLKSCAR